jgi:hypothetical protein
MSKSATGKIVRHHRDSLPPDDTDWARVKAMTDDEIEAAAKADPDAQPLTPQQLARMRRAGDAQPPKRKRGARSAPPSAPGFHEEEGAPYDAGPGKDNKR